MLTHSIPGSDAHINKATGAQGALNVVKKTTADALGNSNSIFMKNPQDAYCLTMPGSKVPSHHLVNNDTYISLHPTKKTLAEYDTLNRVALIREFDRLAGINKFYSEYLLGKSGDAGSSRFLADTTILTMLTLEAKMQAIEDILRSR